MIFYTYTCTVYGLNITHNAEKTWKKTLQVPKYLQKYEREENLTIFFFHYATLCINKTQKGKRQRHETFPYPLKVTGESLPRHNCYCC